VLPNALEDESDRRPKVSSLFSSGSLVFPPLHQW
jgi:hypothetical protein